MSLTRNAPTDHITNSSEQTALLPQVDSDEPPKRSRLPTFQILILIAVRLADNITITSIGPYINQAWFHFFKSCSLLIIYPQMMNELPIVGGDQRKVGYYTGITVRLISEYFFFFWNI